MENKENALKLIRMDEVEATEIDWLWYPQQRREQKPVPGLGEHRHTGG